MKEKNLFPMRVKYTDGEELVAHSPKDLRNGEPFFVVEVNVPEEEKE